MATFHELQYPRVAHCFLRLYCDLLIDFHWEVCGVFEELYVRIKTCITKTGKLNVVTIQNSNMHF